MSATALPIKSSRLRRSVTCREADVINPARGIMVGLGLSALIWTSIGALILR